MQTNITPPENKINTSFPSGVKKDDSIIFNQTVSLDSQTSTITTADSSQNDALQMEVTPLSSTPLYTNDYIPSWFVNYHWDDSAWSYVCFPLISNQWEFDDDLWTDGWTGNALYSVSNCVAHTLAMMLSIFQYLYSGKKIRYSYNWIYGNRHPSDATGEGMIPKYAIEKLMTDGCPPYYCLPRQIPYEYTPSNAEQVIYHIGNGRTAKEIVNNMYSSLINNARLSRVANYTIVTPYYDIDQLQTAILNYGAVLLSFSSTTDIQNCSSSGIVPDTNPADTGGHTITAIGWKTINLKQYWICANSYGYSGDLDHNNAGIYYIPFDYSKMNYAIIVVPNITGVPNQRPINFNWTYNIIKDGALMRTDYDTNHNPTCAYPVNAWEWNMFVRRIDSFRRYRGLYNHQQFWTANSGDNFMYQYIGQSYMALNDLGFNNWSYPYTGDALQASHFNDGKDYMNSIT